MSWWEMPPDRQALRNVVEVQLEAADNNYLISLEARISRHTWHPLFTLSTHQQRDYKERAMQPGSFPPPPNRGPHGAWWRLFLRPAAALAQRSQGPIP